MTNLNNGDNNDNDKNSWLSPEAQENIKKMREALANSNNGDTNFIQLKAGDRKDKLRFNPEKMKPMVIDIKLPDGSVKQVQRCQFAVQDLESSNPAKEWIWTANLTAAKDVLKWIEKKKLVLSVEREGSGMKDTRYYVAPSEAD